MTAIHAFERQYSRLLLLLVLHAAIWVAVTGTNTPLNFLVGLVIGVPVVWITSPRTAYPLAGLPLSFIARARVLLSFAVFFGYELLAANIRMAIDIVRPRLRVRPGILAIPLDLKRDGEITLLANMITLTPGTLSLDVSPDRRTLYVHVVNTGGNPESVRRTIKEDYERRVMEVMR